MIPPLAYLEVQPHPFLIRFSEQFGIRWYGLAYVLGFLACGWLLMRYHRAGRSALPAERVPDLMLALIVGVLLGGRLGYFLLYEPDRLLHRPFDLVRIWEGGMASHGGFAGVFVALWWFGRRHRISILHLGDLVASTVSAGLLFGRIANFLNGELWGKVTTVPWAMIFPRSDPPFPRHPSQLYEAALEGALLLALVQWRFWKSDVGRTQPGRLCGEYLCAYAIVRIFGEWFREPDSGLILGLSRGTFYSSFLLFAGAGLVAYGRRHSSARS
ncbi:MAG: prolipoprotein diacylglyceryl transferase [Verrucomicrobia bacterium RIFCSPLOWO2_12_FULL_64_8]|nr:MAG: prolipoprotein diacylglyceryl transferase [Verrucomicrobia bacterium RIFCSPLOWO2_12_FULL_64_8]